MLTINNTNVVKTARGCDLESSDNTETRPIKDKKTDELRIKTF